MSPHSIAAGDQALELTGEMRLLVTCAQWFIGTADTTDVRGCAEGFGDFANLTRLARAHWIEPLVAWCLKKTVADELYRDGLHYLNRVLLDTAAQHLLLKAELLKVLSVFAECSIAVIPLKGPLLAATLCQEAPWRESVDLDLLVRHADVTRAKNALLARGYRLDSQLPSGEERARFHWRSQLVLLPEGPGPAIDLHWQLVRSLFPLARYFESVWERAERSVLEHREILTLSAEDQLFFLCSHAARHGWSSLRLAVDIAGLLKARKDLDWEYLIRNSRGSDGNRVLAVGLWLVNHLLAVDLPGPVLNYANASLKGTAFPRRLLEQLLGLSQERPLSELAVWLRLTNGWWPRLRCVVACAVMPTDADGQSLILPSLLYFLYYAYRPLRLVLRFGSRWAQLLSTKFLCSSAEENLPTHFRRNSPEG